MRKPAVALVLALVGVAACGSDAAGLPDAVAPASRHDAMRSALTSDAKQLSFSNGDWLEDLGDAPFYGLAWYSRRTDLDGDETTRRDRALARARTLLDDDLVKGDLQEKVMACLGMIEHVAASGDRSDVGRIDFFIDRLGSLSQTFGDYLAAAADESWAIRTYGPTAVTALVTSRTSG